MNHTFFFDAVYSFELNVTDVYGLSTSVIHEISVSSIILPSVLIHAPSNYYNQDKLLLSSSVYFEELWWWIGYIPEGEGENLEVLKTVNVSYYSLIRYQVVKLYNH
jgi:hypothetical protein